MPSKRFKEVSKKINKEHVYPIEEAVALAKEASTAKFDESVEVHCRLGIDPRQSDQQIRATLTFPNSTGKTKRVAAFVGADKEAEAKEAGADIVGGEELIDEVLKSGKIDFDIAVTTPDMMPKLAKAARLLGPRGLMPNPKTDTVGPNVTKMVQEQKAGKASFRTDSTSNIHLLIGKISMEPAKILENFNYFIDVLKKNRPASAKGQFIKSCTLTTTMGPGIKIELPN